MEPPAVTENPAQPGMYAQKDHAQEHPKIAMTETSAPTTHAMQQQANVYMRSIRPRAMTAMPAHRRMFAKTELAWAEIQ